MFRLSLSPGAYRRITLFALFALVFIVVTGSAVRLTGSGLGCTDWPTCENDRLVAPLEYHAMVEFVNRTITGLVSLAVIAAVLGSLVRSPERRDLTWWSLGLVGGVLGQIVLGGLTVLFDLAPPLVMGHFLVSMVLVANAVVLHDRASRPDGARRNELATPEVQMLSRLVVVTAGLVLLTGTVVTGSGPHGGDEDVRRLGFFVPDVTRIHSIGVLLLGGVVLGLLAMVRRGDASAAVFTRAKTLLGVIVAQGAVGYTQYFTGIPVLLVAVHVAGATAVWVAVVRLHLGLSGSVVEPEGAGIDAPLAHLGA